MRQDKQIADLQKGKASYVDISLGVETAENPEEILRRKSVILLSHQPLLSHARSNQVTQMSSALEKDGSDRQRDRQTGR